MVADFIAEIMRRKGTESKKEFAEATGISLNSLSNVTNENRAATWKILMAVLDFAGMDIAEVLTLPPDLKSAGDDKRALHVIGDALRHRGRERDLVDDLVHTLERRTKERIENLKKAKDRAG